MFKNINEFKIINKNFFNKLDNSKKYEWKMGYKNFGILLVGFCKWIHDSSKMDNVDYLFFMSRDGYIIKKTYEILYPNEKVKYLYVSRRSLSLPSMKNSKNIDEILDCIILPPIFTISIFLSNLGFTVEELNNQLSNLNISLTETFKRTSFKKDTRIRTLLKNIYQKILVNADIQYKNLCLYLNQENFKGKIGIVDIGWHNSIQNLLLKITKNVKISGYYLGIYDNSIVFNNENKANGYLYNYGNNMNMQYKTFSFVSLLESMFLSHEGTTISYIKKNNIIIPILAQYEYINEKVSLNIIENFQNGALCFVEDFINSEFKNIKLNSELCCYNIIKFGSKPKTKDINIFGKLSFENYNKNNIINVNHHFLYYMIHPKYMIKDFYKSGWRVAYLKKLLKIPLPYYSIFKIICILFKKD